MKRATSFPFLRCSDGGVIASAWGNEKSMVAFPDGVFETWDPGTDIPVTRSITINPAAITSECRLQSRTILRVACGWESSGTAICEATEHFDFSLGDDGFTHTLQMVIPGKYLKSSVALRTRLLVIEPYANDPLAASAVGSCLWSDETEILLEGYGARFPIELVKLPKTSQYAGWQLEVLDDFDWPFLGAVRLYINSENEIVANAISAGDASDADQMVRLLVYHDVARQLISKAVASGDFRGRYDASHGISPYVKDSVGSAFWNLLRTFFSDKSAEELNALRINDPTQYEYLLQQRLRVLSQR